MFNNKLINWIIAHNHSEIAKLLLQNKQIDPSVNNNTMIEWASEEGFLDVVKLLLQDKRVNPTAGLIPALSNGKDEIAKELLLHGAKYEIGSCNANSNLKNFCENFFKGVAEINKKETSFFDFFKPKTKFFKNAAEELEG